METDNVAYLPRPQTLTADQRQHWQDQASYWGLRQEDAERAMDYAFVQRENALRMLGMVGIERGLPDGA